MRLLTGKVSPEVSPDLRDTDNPAFRILGYHIIVDPYKPLITIAPPPPPQAWVARCALPGGTVEARQRIFPRTTCVTLPGIEPHYDTRAAGPAEIVDQANNGRQITAAGPGWLVNTIPWYPGWSAWVDGEPTPITVVDGALIGVELSEGPHSIILDYRPAGLDDGMAISEIAGGVVAAMAAALSLGVLWRPILRPGLARGFKKWKSRGQPPPTAHPEPVS
jgi:membrane protein YfhO